MGLGCTTIPLERIILASLCLGVQVGCLSFQMGEKLVQGHPPWWFVMILVLETVSWVIKPLVALPYRRPNFAMPLGLEGVSHSPSVFLHQDIWGRLGFVHLRVILPSLRGHHCHN